MDEKIKDNRRLAYPDICKVIAIFIVVSSHCAQIVSGQTWNNFLGGSGIDVAFNMPLFMIISGWFIDVKKLRGTEIVDYILLKYKRLIIPAISWQIVFMLLFYHEIPSVFSVAWFYWYLTALFISLCVIIVFAKVIKNNVLCIILSTAIVVLFPFSYFVNINFMFPFLWTGYGLKKLYDKSFAKYWALFFALVSVPLLFFWNVKYSVYLAPFKSLYLDDTMVYAFIYRFLIGFCLSATLIYLIYVFEKHQIVSWMAKYGKYTLIIYTFSFIINAGFVKLFRFIGFHINEYIVIDVLAVLLSLVVCVCSIHVYKVMFRYTFLRVLFLGE